MRLLAKRIPCTQFEYKQYTQHLQYLQSEWAALIHRALDRRNIFSGGSPPETCLGSSISGATRRDGRVKERENKAPVTEDGVSAGEAQQDTQSWPEF